MLFFHKNQESGIKRSRTVSGFTLVETLVAIAVLLLAIMGPMSLARQTLKSGPVSKDHITAYFLAQDAIEFVKNVRDTNTASGDSWLTGLTPCLTGCIVDTSLSTVSIAEAITPNDGSCTPLRLDPVTNRYGCDASWNASPYSRTTTLTVSVPDQEAVLTTTITWTIDGRPYSFSASQSLFNIGAAIAEGISNLEPPELSGGGPSGTLTAGTVQTIATVLTNKESTCKWDFTSVDYDLMQNFFDTTGGTDHSAVITGLQDGRSYVVYVRCRDQLGNENLASYPISFSVAAPSGGGIVGYWPFDSNANDISGNNRNGTLTNGAVVTTASKIGTGALLLDGLDDYVSIASHTSLQGNQNLTIAFWVKKETATDQRFLGKSSNSTTKDYEIAGIADGTLRWESEVAGSGYSLNSAAGVIGINTWYYVTAVLDKTNDRLTMYVNGAQVAQDTTFGNNSAGTTAAIHVGRRVHSTTNFYTDGSIDDFRMYNFAMSGVQVAALYNAQLSSGATNITFDAAGSVTCSNVATCTLSGFDLGNGSGNNRLVVVNFVTENGSNATNVTFNGVSGTKVTEYDHTNGNLTGSLWYFLDSQLPAAAGSYNIVATANGSVIGNLVTVSSYKNVNQAAPTAFASSECTACTVSETSVNVATANSLVVAATGHAGNQNYTGNNGVTKRAEIDNATAGATNAIGDKIYASTGATLAGHTSGGTARQVNIVAAWAPLAGGSGDTVPPSAVTNLAVSSPTSNSVTLTWTAPGDNGAAGTATSYDIRRASAPIVTATDWSNAAVISGEPAPGVAGTAESMVVSGLSPSTTYYFAIKTSDEVPNTSAVSNSPSGTTIAGTGSLLARWTFDVDGDDVTGNGHDATLTNGALVSATSPKVGGGSLQLDGTNDYANTIDVDEINGANKASLAFWFKFSTAPGTGYRYLLSKYVSGSVDFLAVFNNTNFNIDLGNGAGDSYGYWAYGTNLPTNTWHHAAIVFDGTLTGDANRLKLYINNVQRTLTFPNTATQPIPAIIQGGLSAVPFRIGSREGTTGFNVGNMDDVRVYNYPLSAAEISALYALGSGSAPTAGLVAYYPFDTDGSDASGNGNNGTFANGAAITTAQKAVGTGAANFDGVNDYMSIPHATELNLGPSDWAVAFWQRTTFSGADPDPDIINKSTGGANRDFEISHFSDTRNIYIETKSTATTENAWTTSNAYTLNNWDHVVVMMDTPAMVPTVYVNGVLKTISTDTITTVPPGNTAPIYVGARDTTQRFFTGQIDELRLYNRLLSAAEVQALYTYTGGSSDTLAPAAIAGATVSNPTANSLRLNWTSPGDDGSTGTATTYDIRYSTSPITEGNWSSATQVSGEPTPAVAGTAQNMTISGLNQNTTYYFAIKTSDEVPNISPISNSPSGLTTTTGGGSAVLVGHWPFDANANDSTVNGLNGTLIQQAAITATAPKIGAGSVVFDGTADEVLVAANPLLNITGAMSIAGWVKVTDTTVNRTVLSRNAGASLRGYSLRTETANSAEFHVSTDCTTEDGVQLIGTLTPGTWVHLAGTYEPGVALRIYLNGVLNNSVTTGVPATQCNNAEDVVIGGRPNGTQDPMLGNLDDVRLYTGVLSGAEVAALYAMGSGGDTVAPSAIAGATVSNPTTNSLRLNWTSPGDDGSTGTATSYDIRYSTAAITEGNWSSATQATGEPTPAVAGTAQNMTISGLNSNTTYYFAIKTSDEVPNISAISNSPSGLTSTGNTLIAHWTFDTNMADGVGGYNGTASGNAAISAQRVVGAGSLTLDGTGDYVTTADIPELDTANKFSVSGWYRDAVPANATGRYVFGKWSATQTENSAGANANEFYVNVRTGVAEYGKWTGYGAAIPANTWYHAVMVYDGSLTGNANRLKLYVNNVQQTLAFTGTIQAAGSDLGTNPFRIGTQQTSAGYWNGQIDDLRVYNYALSAAEVTTLYNLGDTTAPAAMTGVTVTNPTTNSLRLNWTSPGDNGSTGTATAYDIRYSTAAITAGNFGSATQVTGEPTPLVAGTAQNMTITGLNSATTYYFAIKASDDVGNDSAISNVPNGTTSGITGLAAHWAFDSNANDSSGNGNNGTLTNGATYNTTQKQVGTASVNLDGTNDYVAVGDTASLDIANSITIAAWIRPASLTGRRPIVSKKCWNTTNGYEFAQNNGRLQFGVGDQNLAGKDEFSNNNVLQTANTWYHVAVTYNETNARFYVNGVAQGAPAMTAALAVNTLPAEVGGSPPTCGTTVYFGGQLDNVKVFNRVLSAAEITTLFNE